MSQTLYEFSSSLKQELNSYGSALEHGAVTRHLQSGKFDWPNLNGDPSRPIFSVLRDQQGLRAFAAAQARGFSFTEQGGEIYYFSDFFVHPRSRSLATLSELLRSQKELFSRVAQPWLGLAIERVPGGLSGVERLISRLGYLASWSSTTYTEVYVTHAPMLDQVKDRAEVNPFLGLSLQARQEFAEEAKAGGGSCATRWSVASLSFFAEREPRAEVWRLRQGKKLVAGALVFKPDHWVEYRPSGKSSVYLAKLRAVEDIRPLRYWFLSHVFGAPAELSSLLTQIFSCAHQKKIEILGVRDVDAKLWAKSVREPVLGRFDNVVSFRQRALLIGDMKKVPDSLCLDSVFL